MAAFDKVKSGYPTMDKALDYIRLGDNVVLQVSNIDEFRFFVEPYVRQANEDGRNLIYFRFAGHERWSESMRRNGIRWILGQDLNSSRSRCTGLLKTKAWMLFMCLTACPICRRCGRQT